MWRVRVTTAEIRYYFAGITGGKDGKVAAFWTPNISESCLFGDRKYAAYVSIGLNRGIVVNADGEREDEPIAPFANGGGI